MDQVVVVRERLNTAIDDEKIKLSVGDFVTKAVAIALHRHPALNASYEADALVIHFRRECRHRRGDRGGPDGAGPPTTPTSWA